MAGTAVFRIVVSSDSMKNATATSHGRSRLLEAAGWGGSDGELARPGGLREDISFCASTLLELTQARAGSTRPLHRLWL